MPKELYACIECGFESLKWLGLCTSCGSWDSLKKIDSVKTSSRKISSSFSKIQKVDKIKKDSRLRLSTGFAELDRIFGGGLVKGEVVLIGGQPGIGKTTLLLQVLDSVSSRKKKCVYVSAEESAEQISIHFERVGLKNSFGILCDDDIDSILAALSKKNCDLLIIDSIQTVKSEDLKGLPGGVGQVKECTSRIVEFAKKTGTSVIIIGHITKGGEIAGPKIVEHIVDAVFYIDGDSARNIRFIKGIKNRFGTTREIGVFTFTKKGFRDVKNLSEMFILSKGARIGVCKGVLFEGRRALIVEVQVLVTKSSFSIAQRVVSGISKSKIQMLCAVLSKYTKTNFFDKDVYVNIAGGIKVKDSSLDLCICVALLSSYYNRKVDSHLISIGEVSLTGQIYPTSLLKESLTAAGRLGYTSILFAQGDIKIGKKRRGYKIIDSVGMIQA